MGVKNSKQNFLPLHVATLWKKIARLDDAFSEVFEREARPIEGQSLQQKGKERRERRGPKKKKLKNEKPKKVSFLGVPQQKSNSWHT